MNLPRTNRQKLNARTVIKRAQIMAETVARELYDPEAVHDVDLNVREAAIILQSGFNKSDMTEEQADAVAAGYNVLRERVLNGDQG